MTAERMLWHEFQLAHLAYEREPSAANWLARQAAHAAWAREFLKAA